MKEEEKRVGSEYDLLDLARITGYSEASPRARPVISVLEDGRQKIDELDRVSRLQGRWQASALLC